MNFPYFMRRVNRVFTNPLMGTFAWLVPPLAVVHHVGRKSGRPYRSPVVAFRTAKGFVIPLTYGRDVDWARNLVAAGGGEVERMGRRCPLRHARIVDGEAAYPHLPAVVRPVLRAADLPGFVLLDDAPKGPGSRMTGGRGGSRSKRD
jgi:deazaflavin-dependent oxidoreductase (nitroreductase family)